MKDEFEKALKEDFGGVFPSFLDMSWDDDNGVYRSQFTEFMFFGFKLGVSENET